LGTATANESGDWSVESLSLSEASHTFTVKAQDAAGNVSVASSSVTATIDVTAPASTVTITKGVDDVDPAGDLATGDTTNDNTVQLVGTSSALLANEKIAIYDGDSLLGYASGTSTGSTAWTFDTTGLTNTTHSFTAVVVDPAGNAGTPTSAFEVTVNAEVPTQTVTIDSVAITNDQTPVITATLSEVIGVGDEIKIYIDGVLIGDITSGHVVVSDDVNLTITPTVNLSEGSHSVSAVVQGSGGNQGAVSSAVTFEIDITNPESPVVKTIAGDGVVNAVELAAGVTLSGYAEAGSTVTLVELSETVTANTAGVWSYNLTEANVTTLAGSTLDVTVTDAAGNVSAATTVNNGSGNALTKDAITPDAPVFASGDADPTVFTFSKSDVGSGKIIVEAEAGARVLLTLGDTTIAATETARQVQPKVLSMSTLSQHQPSKLWVKVAPRSVLR